MGLWDIWKVGKSNFSFKEKDLELQILDNAPPTLQSSVVKYRNRRNSGYDNRDEQFSEDEIEFQILGIQKSMRILSLVQGLEGFYGWSTVEKFEQIRTAILCDLLPPVLFDPSQYFIQPANLMAGGFFDDWNI